MLMLAQKVWKTQTDEKTLTTTRPSGQSLEESQSLIETHLGKLSLLQQDDPYWEACVNLYKLLSRKRNYYNCKEDALANAKGVEEVGIEPWKYQLARIGEKYRRLGGELKTLDNRMTLMDIAGHSIIAAILVSEGEK
tara:strand:- start:132 stop:542 length:411 start_codon:yes stop_codon:yes gene_type:complete